MPIGERVDDLNFANTVDDYKQILYPVLEKKIPGKEFSEIGESGFFDDITNSYNSFINAINGFAQKLNPHDYEPDEFKKSIETFITSYLSESLPHDATEEQIEKIRNDRFYKVTSGDETVDNQIWQNVKQNILNSVSLSPKT